MTTPESTDESPEVADSATTAEEFTSDLRAGLQATPKRIPPKYFYDKRGSELFEEICQLDDYYPTRTEESILTERAGEIAELLGPGAWVIEPGAGECTKAMKLLARLDRPAAFSPIEISGEYLRGVVAGLALQMGKVELLPVCADFTKPMDLPEPSVPYKSRVLFFPGSTIGNLSEAQRATALSRFADLIGEHGWLLIGIDLRKDRETLERAYNDSEGVTAEFNLNVLRRAREEFDVDIDPDAFEHRAVYNEPEGRIEMHLVSKRDQVVVIGDDEVAIAGGEAIVTEHSNKFTIDGFVDEAAGHGFRKERAWTDPKGRFAVILMAR